MGCVKERSRSQKDQQQPSVVIATSPEQASNKVSQIASLYEQSYPGASSTDILRCVISYYDCMVTQQQQLVLQTQQQQVTLQTQQPAQIQPTQQQTAYYPYAVNPYCN
jgi:hypothetical protein